MTIKIDFWFDGMDELSEKEIKDALATVLESGAESTCSEITLIETL